MSTQALLWLGFAVLVLGALAIDLGLFQRKAHVVRPKEALVWSPSASQSALAGVPLAPGPEGPPYQTNACPSFAWSTAKRRERSGTA